MLPVLAGAIAALTGIISGIGAPPRSPIPPPAPQPVVRTIPPPGPASDIPDENPPADVTPPDPEPPASTFVTSTAYCLRGHMADGAPAEVGAVAGNRWPLGTTLDVSDSPWGPGRVVVRDRIGWGSQLDFALPGDCAAARRWGRRSVRVRVP